MTSIKENKTSKKSRRQGNITQKHQGSWEIKYHIPEDENGTIKWISKSIKGTKWEAEKYLRERLAEIDSQRQFGSTSIEWT